MKNLIKLAAASAVAFTALMPLQAAANAGVDPITTSSIKKPVKADGTQYPTNALQGLFF